MFASFDWQEMTSAFIVLFAVIDIIGAIPIIINLKEKGMNVNALKATLISLALLLGFIDMLYRKIISWHIPVYYVGTFFVLTSIHWLITQSPQAEILTHLLSGGLMLGAIFMATDYTTSPMSKQGRIIFAVGCVILTYIIRFYSPYPEGVSFAILIMNGFVPLIDKISVPRVFGVRRKQW